MDFAGSSRFVIAAVIDETGTLLLGPGKCATLTSGKVPVMVDETGTLLLGPGTCATFTFGKALVMIDETGTLLGVGVVTCATPTFGGEGAIV